MNNKSYKYIYGPVSSWRLGSSLGIDPVSGKRKICSFDCIYCQLGRTKIYSDERKIFVSVREVIEEIDSLAPMEIDYITFSGRGEPTLAKNLGQIIKAIKKIRSERIAVLTNSSLMNKEDVRRDLSLADCVVVKLDAASGEVFETVNRPLETIKFDTVIEGIKNFRSCYKGKFALQIMFVEENKKHAEEIAKIAKEMKPDEVQINTPLRPCDVEPLSRAQLDVMKVFFEGLNTISVYEAEKKQVTPISNKETLRRRGKI